MVSSFFCILGVGVSVVLDVLWLVMGRGRPLTNQHKTASLLPKIRSILQLTVDSGFAKHKRHRCLKWVNAALGEWLLKCSSNTIVCYSCRLANTSCKLTGKRLKARRNMQRATRSSPLGTQIRGTSTKAQRGPPTLAPKIWVASVLGWWGTTHPGPNHLREGGGWGQCQRPRLPHCILDSTVSRPGQATDLWHDRIIWSCRIIWHQNLT